MTPVTTTDPVRHAHPRREGPAHTLLRDNPGLIRWAAHRAARFSRRRLPYDEALSDVALAVLTKYEANYDPARGKVTTWVAWQARSVACDHDRRAARHRCRALDAPATGGDDTLSEQLADPAAEAADGGAARADEVRHLRDALATLPAHLRLAVERRFGLDGRGERTLAEVDPAVSVEANRGRLEAALDALRAALARGSAPLSARILAALRGYGRPVAPEALAAEMGVPFGRDFRLAIGGLRKAGGVTLTGGLLGEVTEPPAGGPASPVRPFIGKGVRP